MVRKLRPKSSISPIVINKVNCAFCKTKINKSKGLVPMNCLRKHGNDKAHRICQPCWWSKFAIENSNHKCPACSHNVNKPVNNQICIIIID